MPVTPRILFIGGHDPSGGAGLQADIETAAAHACRAFSLVTCLTTQDSRNVIGIHPQDTGALQAQLKCLLDDVQPHVIKIGLIGSPAIARILARELPDLPLVLDPVLAAGGGTPVADEALVDLIRDQLISRVSLVTPNRAEARRLSRCEDADQAARSLLSAGCPQVLLTGADETTTGAVSNRLLNRDGTRAFDHPLLPHRYHGSGCTLASACACNLARGRDIETAVEGALDWTWETLRRAECPGRGQHLPYRHIPAA